MTGDKKTKTEKVASKGTVKTTSKTAAKPASKTAAKTPKTPSKAAAKTPKTPTKAASKTPSKTASKPASKAPSKTASKPASKPASKASSKPPTAVIKPVIKEKPPQHYMSKEEWDVFIGKMENLLQEEKTEIINTLITNNKDFKEIVDGMDPKDLADIASDDIDRRMIEMVGSQELKRLKLIESAQTRIKQGKYGHCIKCDRQIPPERLEAIPYALMCIDCKSEEERRNR